MSERTTLDCLGQVCPIPVVRLANVAAEAPDGTLIEVLSDDEGAKVDIPVWCRMKSQELVEVEDRDRGWAFIVRVTQAPPA